MLDRRAWRDAGLPTPRVAVNVSALQLHDSHFVMAVQYAIDDDAADHGLDIEITESMLMTQVESSTAKLAAVRRMGVAIAIDGFGRGIRRCSASRACRWTC